jgi:predicted nucleotide-binding protein
MSDTLLQAATNRVPNRVFVVHGRSDPARVQVVELLNRLGLDSIVLHEQASMGRHLLTKFIDEAELATFAVILMTDDDEGRCRGEALRPRARQNVILELGYFLSHLGQAGVCALITPGLETPSDFDGIVYIPMDDTQRWQVMLERELRAANLPVMTA